MNSALFGNLECYFRKRTTSQEVVLFYAHWSLSFAIYWQLERQLGLRHATTNTSVPSANVHVHAMALGVQTITTGTEGQMLNAEMMPTSIATLVPPRQGHGHLIKRVFVGLNSY